MDENQLARRLLALLQQNPDLNLGEAIERSGANIDRSRITQFRHYRGEEAQDIALKLLVPAMVEALDIAVPALIESATRKEYWVSVLYYFINEEPPEDPEEYCAGCATLNRVGNTCVASCDGSRPRNTHSQHNSLTDCLAAPEPPWPDPNVRYPALYLSAGAIDSMEFVRIGCEVSCASAFLFVTAGHIAESQVLDWTDGSYSVSKPVIPSFSGEYAYYYFVGGNYGGFRIITANGWLGLSFTIAVYDLAGNFIREISCWSAYKEVLGNPDAQQQELPSSIVYTPFSNNQFSSVAWQKVFRADDDVCSPYNDVPRGQPPQPRPPRNGRYKNIYLAGSREPKLIKKIHETEFFKHYLTRTADSDIVALTVGRSSDHLCKVSYTKLTGDNITKKETRNPALPEKYPNDWRHPLITYEPYFPYSNENVYLWNNQHNHFLNAQAINGDTDLDFDSNPHYELKLDIELSSKIVVGQAPKYDKFLEVFKLDKPIQSLVCFNPINQIGKGFTVKEIIPANNAGATILDVSAYLNPAKLNSTYNTSNLTCSPPFIKRTEILECWYGSGSGFGGACVSRGFVTYAQLSGLGFSTLTMTDCDGNTSTLAAEYGGFFQMKTPIVEEVIGMCGDE